MAQTYKTDGIILKRWPYRERDKMIRIFTREYGKITTRAISAQKIKSKLAGHLEPFVYTDLHIAKSKTIDIVAGSDTIEPHVTIRSSMDHTALANYFAAVVDAFTHEHDRDTMLFEYILATLHWIDTHPANPLMLYTAIMQFFPFVGYFVELDVCHQCRKPIEIGADGQHADPSFVFKLWNIECADCAGKSLESMTGHSMKLKPLTLKVLRFINTADFDEAAKLQLSGEHWEAVDRFMRTLIRYHLDRELPAEHVFVRLLSDAARFQHIEETAAVATAVDSQSTI